jgi:hypothetical protein
VQHACLAHEGLGDGVGARDAGQLGVEHAGEGEQVIALVLQRDAHRADVPHVLGLADHQLRDDEVEQLPPRRQVRAGQGQDVVAQPMDECLDVAGQPRRPRLGQPGKRQLGGKLGVGMALLLNVGFFRTLRATGGRSGSG